MSEEAALQVRASAARQLIRSKELPPAVALSYVVWPTLGLAEASAAGRRTFGREERDRALELVDAGATWAEAADAIGCSKGLVGDWLRRARLERPSSELASGGVASAGGVRVQVPARAA